MARAISILRMVRYPKRPLPVKQSNAFVEVRKSPIHGMGVFASRRIRKGTRIIEYIGERIDKEESNRRGLALFEESQKTGGASVYIFDLNDKWDLDGNKPYNDARLINHSCEPNSEMVNEDDRLFLFALRDILPGEEITFDYGYDIEHFLDHPCRCGTDSCVGYIVSRSQWKQLKRRLQRGKGKKVTIGA
jgi:SET domain-containing protein